MKEITFLIDETLSVLVKSLERMMMHLSAIIRASTQSKKKTLAFFLYPLKTCTYYITLMGDTHANLLRRYLSSVYSVCIYFQWNIDGIEGFEE